MPKTFVTEIPYIHEDQIAPTVYDDGDDDGYGMDLDESYILGVSGPRGGGKSEILCGFGVRALILDIPVWSNFPIKVKLMRHGEECKLMEARALLFKDLFSISPELRGGLIIIDEYQEWANAYAFMSMQNRLLNAFWSQIRKNQLSFAYAAKKLRWIDIRTREETDIEIRCQDAHKKGGDDRRDYLEGEKIYVDLIDWSGNWTGKPYEDYPIVHQHTFEAKFLWGAFDTNERFDIFEAMRGIKVDLQKSVITDKNEQFNMELLEQQLISMFKRDNTWTGAELFDALDITNTKFKARVSRLIKDMGGKETSRAGGRYFTFNPDSDWKE